ncbi:MAG: hypothetical protein ACYC52_05985, partial [Coriobacteriia bacterium]
MSDGRIEVQIRDIDLGDEIRLGDFFELLASDPGSAHFHPHPLSRDFATSLVQRAGQRRDCFFIAIDVGDVLGYGMLRGW